MPPEPPILQAQGLVKSYGGKRVVDGLDLESQAGRVLGLLGPNGAGKTTTLRMLYGFIRPEAGEIRYFGQPFEQQREAAKRLIGVCTQDDTLDHDFSVEKNLRVYASYFRPGLEDLDLRVQQLIDQFGLREFAQLPPTALSGGYKRRLMIARSLVHRPKILFLDEPTTGLDPAARLDVWRLVAQLRSEGLGIILTTHYMDEAERLSDEIVVLSKGRRVAFGKPREVLGKVLGEHVVVVREDEVDGPALQAWSQEHVGSRPTAVLGEWHLPLTASQLARLSADFPGMRYSLRDPNLDDLFLRLAVENEGR